MQTNYINVTLSFGAELQSVPIRFYSPWRKTLAPASHSYPSVLIRGKKISCRSLDRLEPQTPNPKP